MVTRFVGLSSPEGTPGLPTLTLLLLRLRKTRELYTETTNFYRNLLGDVATSLCTVLNICEPKFHGLDFLNRASLRHAAHLLRWQFRYHVA